MITKFGAHWNHLGSFFFKSRFLESIPGDCDSVNLGLRTGLCKSFPGDVNIHSGTIGMDCLCQFSALLMM